MIHRYCMAVLAVAVLVGASDLVQAQGSRSIWDGVYTTAQATRGRADYLQNCARCHGSGLAGMDEIPPLQGSQLMVDFDGQTAGDLVHRIQTTMPMDNPGTLGPKTVADIAAYILKENGLPAGSTELPSDPSSQTLIRFQAVKPGS
ncbi:MAG: c-type cytochrome [Rhizomicrobium sp.]